MLCSHQSRPKHATIQKEHFTHYICIFRTFIFHFYLFSKTFAVLQLTIYLFWGWFESLFFDYYLKILISQEANQPCHQISKPKGPDISNPHFEFGVCNVAISILKCNKLLVLVIKLTQLTKPTSSILICYSFGWGLFKPTLIEKM